MLWNVAIAVDTNYAVFAIKPGCAAVRFCGADSMWKTIINPITEDTASNAGWDADNLKKIHDTTDATTGATDADIARSKSILDIEKSFTVKYTAAADYVAGNVAKWYTDPIVTNSFLKQNIDHWFI
jgi:hypothetical protein